MIISMIPGVKDAGEPAVGSFPTDFRKLNIRDQSSEIRVQRSKMIETEEDTTEGSLNYMSCEKNSFIVRVHESVPWSVIHK